MPSSQQQTEAPSPSAEADSDSGSKPNVAGIAAGVVVGVVAVAGIAIGLFFFMRHRKQKAAEEEYKRNQVSDFMRHGGTSGEGKPPNTGYSNMSDQRLDPEAGRRNSAGSIADDQDYSRRILRVSDAFFFVSNHSLANSSTRSPTPRKRLSFSLSPQASTERSGFVFIEENGHERWCHQRKNIQNKKPAPRKPKSNLPISPPQPPQKRSPSRLSKQRKDETTHRRLYRKRKNPPHLFPSSPKTERPRPRCSSGSAGGAPPIFLAFSTLLLAFFSFLLNYRPYRHYLSFFPTTTTITKAIQEDRKEHANTARARNHRNRHREARDGSSVFFSFSLTFLHLLACLLGHENVCRVRVKED